MAENPFVEIIDDKREADVKNNIEAKAISGDNPFLPLIDQKRQSDSVLFNTAMQEARDTDPDQYAKQNQLSKQTGLPVDVVSRNQEKVEKQAPFLSGDYDRLHREFPGTAGFLAEEDNAKWAKDDVENLSVIEQIAKMNADPGLLSTLGRSANYGLAQIDRGIAQSPAMIYNLGAALYNIAAIPQNFAADQFGFEALRAPEAGTAPDWLLNNPVAEYYTRMAEQFAPEEVYQDPIQLMKEGDGKQAARAIAAQVVANLPQQLFLIGSTIAGQPQVGLAVMGGLSASNATAEAQENGKSALMTTIDAFTQGGIEVATEQYGTVGIFKHWETQLIKSFGKGTAKQIITDAGKAIAAAFFGEGFEEIVASVGQDVSDYITGNPEALDGYIQRAMNAFLIGSFSGGLISAPSVITSATAKSIKASQDGKFWDEELNASGQSKLRQRSPEKYEQFLNKVNSENGKPKNIYVSHDALRTFFQDENGRVNEEYFNKFIEEMEIKDQLAEAAATGKEFEISAAKFAAKYAGSDLSQALRPDIRFDPDGMTQREQAQLQQEYARMVQDMQAEYAELVENQKLPQELQAIRDKMLLPKDVGGAEMSAEEADAQLQVLASGLMTFARRAGIPFDEYVKQVNPVLNVGGQFIKGTDALTQDNASVLRPAPLPKGMDKSDSFRFKTDSGGDVAGRITKEGLFVSNIAVKNRGRGEGKEILSALIDYAISEGIENIGSISANKYFRNTFKFFEDAGELVPVEKGASGDTIRWRIERKGTDALTQSSEIFTHQVGTDPNSAVEVLKNPTAADVRALDKEYKTDNPKSTEPSIRKTYDTEGNTYVWRADKAVHDDVERTIKNKFGVDANQNLTPKELFQEDHKQADPLIQEALKYDTWEAFHQAVIPNKEARRNYIRKLKQDKQIRFVSSEIDRGDGIHSPADPESGAPLYDLSDNGIYPEDVYSAQALRYYGTGEDAMDAKALDIIRMAEGNPHKQVRVYRAVEKDGKPIQPGDWVTTVRQYAKEHGEANLNGEYKIVSKLVSAVDLFTEGNSWLEWGYHPQPFNILPSAYAIKRENRKRWFAAREEDPKAQSKADPLIQEAKNYDNAEDFFYAAVGKGTHDVLYHKIGSKDIEIIKNPTAQDIKQLKKEFAADFPQGQDEPAVRTTYDEKGNKYIWRSDKAIHGDIEPLLRDKYGVYASQDQWTGKRYLTGLWNEAQRSDTLFQTVPAGDELVGMHNLSAENLLHADKMGGLAVPSLSIAKQKHPLSGFGEISLVGSPELINPRRKSTKVFNADIYSPRYPDVKYELDRKEINDVGERYFGQAAEELGTSFARETEYFEAKVQRAVDLSEFSAALVPNNVSQKVINVLQKNGITDIIKYDPQRGERDNRDKALAELKNKRPELFFQEGPQPRGSVQFTDAQTIINLYNSANLSTFLHETGHVFMNEMQKLVEAGVADEQLQKDYETLKEFVGGDINSREAQEKLARGFEAYLREGKAPSVKLADAFSRFRDWLTAIYRTVRGLNVEINDEVRGVFDRVLASENEIEEAKQFYRAKKSLVDLIPVTKAQRQKVLKAKDASDEEALRKTVKERLNIYLRLQGGKAAIREQAEKEIDSTPVYQAIKEAVDKGGLDAKVIEEIYGKETVKTLRSNHPGVVKQQRNKKAKDRTYYAEVLSYGGIDPDSMTPLEKKYFKEHGLFGLFRKKGRGLDDIASEMQSVGVLNVPDNQNPGDYLKSLLEQKETLPNEDAYVPVDEAITLSDLAAEYNFESEDALLTEMKKAPRRSQAITTRAAEILQQKEQELLRDLKSGEQVPGDEALHNDKSLTYLITEASILADKLAKAKNRRPERIEEKLYRAAADEVIGKKTVRLATRYDLYARAEQRFAKQVEEALLNQDLEAALLAKKKQLLNHAMVQSAIKAREQKLKIENYFKAKNYKAKLNRTENQFAEAAMDITSTYALGTAKDLLPKSTEALKKVYEADEILAAQIPDWVLNKQKPVNFKDYRDLSMNNFLQLNDAVRSILQYGSDVMKSAEEGEAQTRQEWIDASVAIMETLKDRKDAKLNELRQDTRRTSRAVGLMDGFTSGATMMQFLSDWMDKFQFMEKGTFGPFRTLYNKVLKAETQYQEHRQRVLTESKKAWDILGKATDRLRQEHGRKIEIEGLPVPEDLQRTNRKYWTANRMIAILLNTGNEGNMTAMQRGYGFTPEQIQKVASYFTTEELEAIQTVWDSADLLFPELDETHFSIYNRHLGKVDPQPISFTSSEGETVELKGGYHPLIFDHKINERAAEHFEADMMKNQTQAVIRSSKPEDGMTYARKPGHSLPPLLDTSIWFTHVNNTARYISHARILRDLNLITRDKKWSAELKKRAGEDHYKALRSWLQYNANPTKRSHLNNLDRKSSWLSDVLRSTSTAAILGLKNAVGIKQRASMVNAAQAMGKESLGGGWKWIMKAYGEVDWRTSALGIQNTDTWADITKKSVYMKTRDGNIDREISDMRRNLDPVPHKIQILGKEFQAKDIQDFSFFWIKLNDRAAVSIVWTAAYNQFIAEKADPAMAPADQSKAAIAYADGIVQDTQPSSLNAELSELQRAEGWLRLFTSFMTYTLKYGNRVMQHYRAWNQGSISNKEFFNHVIQEQIGQAYLAMLITSAVSGGDLPEWWEVLLEPFAMLVSWVPLVRDIASYYKYGSEIGRTPLAEAPTRFAKAAAAPFKVITGNQEFTQALWDIGRAIEVIYKVPVLNTVKEFQKVYENLTD